MSSVKLKGLALSALAVASLAASRADATTTVNVAVAANFTATMNALIAAYKVINPGTNITFTSRLVQRAADPDHQWHAQI